MMFNLHDFVIEGFLETIALNIYKRKQCLTRYVENYSDHKYRNLQRSYSTSFNLRQEVFIGRVKIDLKSIGIYREMDLTLVKIKDEL